MKDEIKQRIDNIEEQIKEIAIAIVQLDILRNELVEAYAEQFGKKNEKTPEGMRIKPWYGWGHYEEEHR